MEGRHAHHTTTKPNHKPLVFTKMEALVREMQNPETGVPIRSLKVFLKSIPSAFMASPSLLAAVASPDCMVRSDQSSEVKGYDLIEWLLERLEIEDSTEAIHLANLLCQYGYFFPVGDSRSLIVKDDSSLYRFQTPYYWPSQIHSDDTTDYAIYLTKRASRNKQKHALEDYEVDAYNRLKKALAHRWDFVTMQAEEQVKLAKDRKKDDKTVTDSQERAYWRVYRPPPGFTNCLETAPVPDKTNMANRVRKKTVEDLKKNKEFLLSAIARTRQKVSQAAEGLLTHAETYFEYDPFLTPIHPSNPWLSDDTTFWVLNESIVEVPTEKRVKRWAISMEELINDGMGQEEFTAYLRKEYCHENIRFWQAVNELRWGPTANVSERVQNIYEEFLKPGAPCEINIDGKTMESTQLLMKSPNRFTYDLASEHVYILLLKKDCYPRFLRSEMYKTLLANALQPLQKKRFFSFVPGKKKISTPAAAAPNNITISQTPQPLKRIGSDDQAALAAITGGSGSGGELHGSSGNKLDCDPPYSCAERQTLASNLEPTMSNAVCPWEPQHNICPWEAIDPPVKNQPQHQQQSQQQQQPPQQAATSQHQVLVKQESLASKIRPDRSKSVDVSSSSVPKRQGSVSVTPSLGVELSDQAQAVAAANICPWESQELPNRGATEKSRSVDVDVIPFEVSEAVKKSSTSSSPETTGWEPAKSKASRPICERIVSIQVCPWKESDEEGESQVGKQEHKRHPSVDSVGKPEEIKKELKEITEKPTSLPVDSRPGVASEGTSSPSSTCSSSSHSEQPRRIKIDYTVKSGHLPGQYGLPLSSSSPAGPTSPGAQPPQFSSGGSGGSTTSTSSGQQQQTAPRPESPKEPGKLPCPSEGGSKPTSPKIASNVVAPWEDTQPKKKVTDICPWEDEESCKVDTPFVKTYATLGYL